MPTITIYLTNELYDKIKDSPSKIVRAALEHYFKDEDNEPGAASEEPHRDKPTQKDTQTA